jgi:hypothetical protein
MFAAVAVPFLLLDLATGHWFYLKMVVYHSLPLSRSTLTRLLQFALWDDQWPLLLVAGSYALYILTHLRAAFRVGTVRSLPLLIPLFMAASILTLPTGAVVGADHNHLLMLGLATCASTGAALASLLHRLSTQTPPPLQTVPILSVLALLVLMGYVLFTSEPSTIGYGPDLAYPSAEERDQLRKIALNMRETPGNPFFSDDPGMIALAGKQTLFLTAGRPCRHDTFTPGVLEAIRDGYTLIFRDVFFTYAPK